MSIFATACIEVICSYERSTRARSCMSSRQQPLQGITSRRVCGCSTRGSIRIQMCSISSTIFGQNA